MTGKGIIFEHEVADKLKGQGYSHVKVTRATRDYGADILAFKEGLEHVVQCKRYKGTVGFNAIKDISTAMDIYQADKGILVCDTEFSKPVYEAARRIEKPIELISLDELRSWKKQIVSRIKYVPHLFQRTILSKLNKHRKRGNSAALLVMATGLGKTLVAAWDLKNQLKKGEKALFLVHRKDILVDNAEKFHAVINDDKNQFKLGIYFEGKKFNKSDDIVFSTFQSIVKHYKTIPKNYFQYVIIDEAHHSPAPTYAKVFSHFNPKFILGITATPKRLTKEDNSFIKDVFGEPLVDLDLAESLLRDYLSPVKYSVFCDNIDYEKLKATNRKLSIERLNQSYFIPTKDEDIERIIRLESDRLKHPKTIIFCPNIKYINSVKSIGLFADAAVYHSNMSDFDRAIVFRRFKLGKIRTLLVVDLFNEGIDIPDANLVVFLRTTYSPTIFFQQLGRGLRKAKDKKCLRVLDFVGALSKVKKVINVFGHLLIIQDFVEKVDTKKRLSNIYREKKYKAAGMLDPLELDFYQAGKLVKHRETLFRRKNFLAEIRFLKKHLIKSEGWTEEEIINELRPICEKLGYFPSGGYLIGIGRADLDAQVSQKGGVYYLAQKLGYPVLQKPPGYWNSWKNLKQELLRLSKKLGHFPSTSELENLGYPMLKQAIRRFGRHAEIAKKLGFNYKGRATEVYWKNWKNLKRRLAPICKKINKMPSAGYLRKIKQNDLAIAISRKWGGFSKVAKRMGCMPNERPKGYWLKKENVKKELQMIFRKWGRIPSGRELQRMGYSMLSSAIKRFGKYGEIIRSFGFDYKSPEAISTWTTKTLKKELSLACGKVDVLPTSSFLHSIGRFDIINAIYSKYDSFLNAAKILNLKYEGRKPSGYWTWERLKNELLPICKRLDCMPNVNQLKKAGRADLVSVINKKGGGFRDVAKKLGYGVQRKPPGYWDNLKNLKRELVPIYRKLGKMPTQDYLTKTGRSDLIGAISKKWGGMRNVISKLQW